MADGGLRIALVCEDHAHRFLATTLADRVLLQEASRRAADWIDADSLAWHRHYCGPPDSEDTFYSMSRVKQAAENLGTAITIMGRPIKLRGFIDGQPLAPAAGFWRRVLLSVATHEPRPDLILIVHDTDGDPATLDGLYQALPLVTHAVPVIVATPHQDAEAWFVAGLVPRDNLERAWHAECRRELGFDPCEEPHRLTARPNDACTDAKRVLRRLVAGENISRSPHVTELPELSERTLHDLEHLQRRGDGSRLNAYLEAVRSTLVPRLMPGPPRA